jgi:hypothetical protein
MCERAKAAEFATVRGMRAHVRGGTRSKPEVSLFVADVDGCGQVAATSALSSWPGGRGFTEWSSADRLK